MNKNVKLFLVLFCIILLFVFSYFVLSSNGKIPQNPDGTIGNSAGNLNNGGLFCQSGDIVYFSNAYDNGCLYTMNVDETNIKKLSNSQVGYINVAGDYLYYYQENSSAASAIGYVSDIFGVYRCKTNGKDVFCLDKDRSVCIQLVGDTLYYQHYEDSKGVTLYSIGTDKSDKKEVISSVINPACAVGNSIYYNGVDDDHYLYRMDTSTNTSTVIWEGNLWNPIVEGDYVYYMDISSNYRLCRYSMSSGRVEVLTSDRLDYFNVYGNIIYYQKSSASSPALKRINVDGTNEEIVYEGVCENINITSSYVYFNLYDIPTPVYKTPTFGAINVNTFSAASDAVVVE